MKGYRMKKISIVIWSLVISISAGKAVAEKMTDADRIKAKTIAVEIIQMRNELAASLIQSDMTITPDIFKNVCGAVKKRAMELAKKENVRIRHAAIKNRNPAHAATEEETEFHQAFLEHPDMEDIRNETELDGKRYKRYIRPIYVEQACLACHGEKEKRPDFIKKKYPDDKAFGFEAGDLRGIIEVMVPVE